MRYEIYLYTPDKMPVFCKKAIAEYEKRLSRYGKIGLHTVRKEREWVQLLDQAEDGYYLLAGPSIFSEELSLQMTEWEQGRRKAISFYVDQNYGEAMPDRYRDKFETFSVSDFRISGPMTAMILYEQIYRGYRIMHNHPYHK